MKSKNFIFFIIAVLVVVALLGFNLLKENSKDYVLKINEENISQKEFETYLFEQKVSFEEKGGEDIWETDFDGVSAKEVAKQNALNSMLLVKTAVVNAQNIGVFLDKKDTSNLKEEAKAFQQKINSKTDINLSLKMATKIVKENKLQEKVFEYVTHNYELSENDFNAYFESYINENRKDFSTTTANIISLEKNAPNAKSLIVQIKRELQNTDDIKKIKKLPSVNVLENININNIYLPEDLEDYIYSLEKNSFSNILEINNSYYIFNILDIDWDFDISKENLKEDYILNKKLEIYKNQTEKWSKDITVIKNQEIWNKISLD